MTFDLASARARAGLQPNDTSKDAMLSASLGAALGLAERYCDRKFMRQSELAELVHFVGNEAQVDRYPIVAVSSVQSDGKAITAFQVNKSAGRILFSSSVAALLLEVDYEGGYQDLPGDLEYALWLIFDGVWASMSGAAGSTSAISRITVPDVGSISFDAAASANGIGAVVSEAAEAVLDLYRRSTC